MGLWDDAERQKRELERHAEWAREGANLRRAEVVAQKAAVREFIAGVKRLGIAPQKHKWYNRAGSGSHSWLRGVIGWSTSNPREERRYGGLVVTPDAQLYSTDLFWKRKPFDLTELQSFGGGYDNPSIPLAELLRDGLARAM